MNRAFNPDVLLYLADKEMHFGRRPWLGSDVGNEDCGRRNVRTVQRGSSGIYFPNIMSILIPPYSRRIMLYLSKSKVREKIDKRVDAERQRSRR